MRGKPRPLGRGGIARLALQALFPLSFLLFAILHEWSRESVRDEFAKINEFTIGRVVFEGINVPVTPDAVVDVGAASATANRNLVVDACINPRNYFNPGVVAAKLLCLQFFPESVVVLHWYTVFTQRVFEEVLFAIP